MTTTVIVQARMTSTRLPGKVLKDLGGATVLSHVLRRCQAVPGVDVVCCATTEGPETDPVVAEARRCGAEVFRGSEHDVLDRYRRAAEALDADVVVRVTSDCPFIDPGICGRVIHLREMAGADYASNNLTRSWPLGLDCEAFTRAALVRAAAEAREPDEREHVTPWLRRHDGLCRVNLYRAEGSLASLRWTLDYPDDYAFLQALMRHLPAPPAIPAFEEVLAVLERHPEIATINAHCRQAATG
ncbi:MAG: cytidylyltransferase domain-containing protein [Alphaproteobacteria bacterium]